MKNNNWIEYKIKIRERLRVFCLKILELSEKMPKTVRGNVINYQITKSGSSAYANYRAALRGRSKAEFFSKLCVSIEELDESEMWLEVIMTSKIFDDDFIKELHEDSLELLRMLANMRRLLGD